MLIRCLLTSIIFSTCAFSQEVTNCRCCNLSRVHPAYLKDLPSPKFRENIGKCHLKITTSSPQAQKWFDQGLSHLHGFWEFEAYRSFLEALKHDPNCSMAYWGIAMSLPGKENEAASERSEALKLALKNGTSVTPHEKAYLAMLQKLIESGPSKAIPELEKIISAFPADNNAVAWFALWSHQRYRDGLPHPKTKRLWKNYRQLWRNRPMMLL